MSMSHYAAQAYSKTAVHTTVEAASPHQLVSMLFDGLLKHLRMARTHMVNGNVAEKASSISKALNILTQGLHASLNPEAGGEVAQSLATLYEYCEQRLFLANAQNQIAMIDEVVALIEPVRVAWEAIASYASTHTGA
jgi:flagellar protein FliS